MTNENKTISVIVVLIAVLLMAGCTIARVAIDEARCGGARVCQ